MIRLVRLSSILMIVLKLVVIALLFGIFFGLPQSTVHRLSQGLYIYILLFSFIHLLVRLNAKEGLLFVLFGFCLPAAMEFLGTKTSLIFGDYYYTDKVQPQLLNTVPLWTISYWRFGLYSAYAWAVLVFRLDRFSSIMRRLLAAMCGALMMMALDLSIDPVEVKRGVWVWRHGGWYFGIPLSNFLGWWFTAFVALGLILIFGLESGSRRRYCKLPWAYHLPATDIFTEAIVYLALSIASGVAASGVIGLLALTPFAVVGWQKYRTLDAP